MPDKKLADNLSNNSPILSNGLSDNEIKKALEYCSKQGITSECEKCKMPKNTCRTELIGYAFDLINRLQAEIKDLQKVVVDDYASEYDNKIKAEAYKECIEKVKEKLRDIAKIDWQDNYYYLVGVAFFDNILTELVGDNNGNI